MLPTFFTDILFHVSAFFIYDFCLGIKPSNLKEDEFGYGYLTNVTEFGIYDFFTANAHVSRANFIAALNTPFKTSEVDSNGEIQIIERIHCNIVFDQRLLSFIDATEFHTAFMKVWDNPEDYL